MKTKQGKKVKAQLEMVGNCYFNNYGVEVYLLENGNIFLQALKHGRKIPDHHLEMLVDDFEARFRNENKSNIDLVLFRTIISALAKHFRTS